MGLCPRGHKIKGIPKSGPAHYDGWMQPAQRHPLIAGTVVTSLGTLASRVLGMLRDMATASLLGMSGSEVMDAFVIAYRIPNLFRRMFGEGALTASYLPVLAAELERDPRRAWQLATVLITWLAVLLAVLVLAGELLLAAMWIVWGEVPGVGLLAGLGAVMLPYLMLICVAAQLTATLHALAHFTVPALTPTVLNLVWLVAACAIAPYAPSQQAQAYVLAIGIVLAGVLQVAVQVPMLLRLGFRFDYAPAAVRGAIRQITHNMAPMMLGLAMTQINTLNDSLIAWGLAATPGGPEYIPWLPGSVRYPMERGATAAIYYGERLYEFPLGLVGLAVATAIFPLLSRHAARGDRRRLAADLTLGLRLVISLGLPAGIGLVILAEPLARLLFERGQFTPEDTLRAARMIGWYGTGVWAFCASPVVVRGFYAIGDNSTPARVAAWMVGLDLALNLMLIWPMAEAGLAVSTALGAAVQVAVLVMLFARRNHPLHWASLAATAMRTMLSTLLMAAGAILALAQVPSAPGLDNAVLRVLLPVAAAVCVYCGVFRLLGGRELGMLLGRGSHEP